MNEPQLANMRQFSSGQVLLRFVLRLTIFCVFASLSAAGFRVMLPTFLTLSVLSCVIAAAFRREAIFGHALTHWDEAAGCGALACLIAELPLNS
ncbi:MAG TPA: hypothetical protein VLX44_13610 [Xanthobacteraceae bacterium]|nr:hypothetical protein [Xanthobacteraceae bacterium]